jgi:methionyl-tRNA formyltransferase
MKVVFMGTAELSCASLKALASDEQFSVAAVVTQPDRPKGRDLKPQSSPVKVLAQKLGRQVLQPARARDEQFIAHLRGLNPELIVVAAYGQILPPDILDLPRYGCLNVHTSLLPKYRGAAPIQWAIALGDAETGVTIMKMDAGLDTGPTLAQRRTPISPEDDSASLHDRLARLGAELLVQTIPDYVAGKIQPRPQPAEGVSLAPKIKKEDGRIDWNLPAQTIWNRLRGFRPWPGAFTFLSKTVEGTAPSVPQHPGGQGGDEALPSKMIKIWKAEPAVGFVGRDGPPGRPQGSETAAGHLGEATLPGTILSADQNGILVACGRGALRILELQPEGRRRMNAAEFLAGHRLKAGDRFER